MSFGKMTFALIFESHSRRPFTSAPGRLERSLVRGSLSLRRSATHASAPIVSVGNPLRNPATSAATSTLRYEETYDAMRIAYYAPGIRTIGEHRESRDGNTTW